MLSPCIASESWLLTFSWPRTAALTVAICMTETQSQPLHLKRRENLPNIVIFFPSLTIKGIFVSRNSPPLRVTFQSYRLLQYSHLCLNSTVVPPCVSFPIGRFGAQFLRLSGVTFEFLSSFSNCLLAVVHEALKAPVLVGVLSLPSIAARSRQREGLLCDL
jgi:hypothetical protein